MQSALRVGTVALALVVLVAGSAGAAPPSLQEAWSASVVVIDQGQFDDDPNLEFLVFPSGGGVFQIIDGSTGAPEGNLDNIFNNLNNFTSQVFDIEEDGRDELLVSFDPGIGPMITALYDWTPGGGWQEVFSHNDAYVSVQATALRNRELDLVENQTQDIVIRDLLGNVFWVASVEISGWSGAGFIESLQIQDFDSDNLDEILVTQNFSGMATTRLIDFPATQTAVGDTPGSASVRLLSYPNPSDGSTTIAFDLPRDGRARVRIYDAQGRLVRDLVDEDLQSGRHSVPWDGRSNQGLPVAAGAYFYRLEAPGVRDANRLVRVR